MNLEKYNPHWKESFVYPFTLDRSIFKVLAKNLSNRPIITISGLRRTGKTVLMQQLMNKLIQDHVDRTSILYYSFDEEQPKIEDILHAFEKTANIDRNKTKLYVFFDEIQKLDDWQNQIKYYYDTSTIKFFVSGSSSLFIRKKSKESLAGRSFDFYLPPLSFREFLIFRAKEALLKKDSLFQEELKREFALYIKRQFVETVHEREEFIAAYVKSILEKVIYIDIPKVFSIDHQDLLLRLLKIIASHPGMIIEYENLAKELGINRITLSNYLFYLEEAFLLKKMYNFSRNRLTSEKKLKRFYLSSTSFFPYLSPEVEESRLIENLIAIETRAKFFWRTPFKDEVDFVLENFHNQEICPVEVKYKNIISTKDTKTLVNFCKKMHLDEGIIITKDLTEEKVFVKDSKKIKIHFLPVWKFLLSL